jgi:hypothetical protein
LLAAAMLAATGAHAQLFKCVTREGKTIYQDGKCEETAKQSTLRVQTPAAAAEASEAPAADAVETVVGYTVCAERVPGFSGKYADVYDGWKSRNTAGLERLSAQTESRRLETRLREERARQEDMSARCAALARIILPQGAPLR